MTSTRQQPAAARENLHRLMREPARASYPLTAHQSAIWLLQELAPDSLAYTAHNAITLRGALDVERLRRAIQTLVDRHESLTAAVRLGDDGVAQHVGAQPTASIEQRALAPDGLDATLAAIARVPFDLTAGPLIRWTLVRTAADEHVLVQSEHHVIHDGWSSRLLLRELADLYRLGANGLTDEPCQYGDFVRWQERWLASPAADAQLEVWRALLADPPEAPAPAAGDDLSRPGGSLRATVEADVMDALDTLARELHVTQFALALAAYADVVGDALGGAQIGVASGFANRRAVGSESVVGMCVNTLVLPIRLRPPDAWRELVGDVFDTVLTALDNQEYPFPQLVAALDPPRALGQTPYAQTAFSLHNAPAPPLDFGDVAAELFEGLHPGAAKFDLNVIAIAAPAPPGAPRGLALNWEWTNGRFTRSDVEQLAAAWQDRLRRWAADAAHRTTRS